MINNQLAKYIREAWMWAASSLAALIWLSGASNIVEVSETLKEFLGAWSKLAYDFFHVLFELLHIPITLSIGQSNLLTLITIVFSIWVRNNVFDKPDKIFQNNPVSIDIILDTKTDSPKEFIFSFLRFYLIISIFGCFMAPIIFGSTSFLETYDATEPLRYFFMFLPLAMLLSSVAFPHLFWTNILIGNKIELSIFRKTMFTIGKRSKNYNNNTILTTNILMVIVTHILTLFSLWLNYFMYTEWFFVSKQETMHSVTYIILFVSLFSLSFLAFQTSAKPVLIVIISGTTLLIGDLIIHALSISFNQLAVI